MRAARGSEVALQSRIRFQGKRKEKIAGGWASGFRLETVNFAKRPPSGKRPVKQPFGLLDRRVHRRRQGLGVNGLIVVEAAAQHQGRGEDGEGQNRAHLTNSP